MRKSHLGICGLAALVAFSACTAEIAEPADEVGVREQALSCATSPWLGTFIGDVVIDDQDDADALSCITSLYGSLTIADSDAFEIALPNLRSIFGDVHIVYSSDTAPSLCDECRVRTVSLPRLTRIIGDVDLKYPGANGGFYGATQDIGLEAVTTLIGDVHLEIDNFGANVRGLSALTRLDGDLSVWVRTGDIFFGTFLRELRLVTGDVRFLQGGNTFSLLTKLETVLGTFAVHNLLLITNQGSNFPALRTVGKNLELRDVNISGPDNGTRIFPALATIGGYLDVRGRRSSTLHTFAVARADVRLFGLRLVDTDSATFGAFDPRLFPLGHIDVRDNTLMCPESAEALIEAERTQGFFGLATASGNGASATCP